MFDLFCYGLIPDVDAIIEVASGEFTPITGSELSDYRPEGDVSLLKAWKFDDFDSEYSLGVSVATLTDQIKEQLPGYETAHACTLALPKLGSVDSIRREVRALVGRDADETFDQEPFRAHAWMGETDEMRVHVYYYAPLSGEPGGLLSAAVMQKSTSVNPLAVVPANPLAPPDPFEGSFVGEALSAEVRKSGEAYAGSLKVNGEFYAFEARASGFSLFGEFRAGDEAFSFDAELRDDGDTLQLSTGGAEYTLARADAAGSSFAPNPLAKPSTSEQATKPEKTEPPALFGAGQKQGNGAEGGDSVLAQGSAASLSRDAAAAYVEALHFSLYQVNESAMVAELPQETVFAALAKEFPSFDSETQRELANARAIWTETLAGWDSSSPDDQLEFVTEILGLAGFDTAGLSAGQPEGYSAAASHAGSNSDSYYPSYNQSAEEMERESYLNSGATEAGDGTYEVYDSSTGSYNYE